MNFLDGIAHMGEIRNIDEMRADIVSVNGGGCRVCDVEDVDLYSLRGKGIGNGFADTHGCTGDDGNLAVEPSWHRARGSALRPTPSRRVPTSTIRYA